MASVGYSPLQSAHVVRPLTVAHKYPPTDTTKPFGSVTMQRKRQVPTAVSIWSNDAPNEATSRKTLETTSCESQCTVAPTPVDDPTQGRRVRFGTDNFRNSRKEP